MAEELKLKRTVAKAQFTRAETSLRKALEDKSSPASTINRKYDELKSKWQIVQDAHDFYTATEELEGKSEVETAWINELTERFDKIEVDADKLLEKFEEKKAPVEEKGKGRQESKEPNQIPLGRVNLEKFDGDIRKYPTFKESFINNILPLCPKAQCAFYLRNHLEQIVKEEVANVEDDINLLWERLDSKYAKYSRYVEVVLEDLAKTTKGDAKATLRLINTVEKAKRDLDRIGAGQEMCNSFIIAQIEKKFPEEMRFEWIKEVASHAEEDSKYRFKLLMVFLQRWRQMIEYDEAAIRKVQEKKVGTIHVAEAGVRRDDKKSETCWIHKDSGAHPIWRCRIFQEKTLEERLEMANQQGACHACLEVDCEGAKKPENCKRQFKCQIDGCSEYHNVLLHA